MLSYCSHNTIERGDLICRLRAVADYLEENPDPEEKQVIGFVDGEPVYRQEELPEDRQEYNKAGNSLLCGHRGGFTRYTSYDEGDEGEEITRNTIVCNHCGGLSLQEDLDEPDLEQIQGLIEAEDREAGYKGSPLEENKEGWEIWEERDGILSGIVNGQEIWIQVDEVDEEEEEED